MDGALHGGNQPVLETVDSAAMTRFEDIVYGSLPTERDREVLLQKLSLGCQTKPAGTVVTT